MPFSEGIRVGYDKLFVVVGIKEVINVVLLIPKLDSSYIIILNPAVMISYSWRKFIDLLDRFS